MKHKSTLQALEPVEIRLAAAVRVRREIERLRTIEQALDADAHAIANDVLGGKAAVVEVILEALKEPLETDQNDFDQEAVAAFLASEHALRLDGVAPAVAAAAPSAPAAAPATSVATPQKPIEAPATPTEPAAGEGRQVVQPSDEAPYAGSTSRAVAVEPPSGPVQANPVAPPAAAAQAPTAATSVEPAAEVAGRAPPVDPAPTAQDGSQDQSAALLAIRLAKYDIVMPNDYFGVAFDMTKRPEADAILGEAALFVADQTPLDASPYKGDRGKVHWRRRLFEDAYAYFELNPPRLIDGDPVETALPAPPAHERQTSVVDTAQDLLARPTSEIRLEQEMVQPPQGGDEETSGLVGGESQETGPDEGSTSLVAAPAGSETEAVFELPLGNRDGGSGAEATVSTPAATSEPPVTGQVIGFPGAHAAARSPAIQGVDDIVDVFEDNGAGPSGQDIADERIAGSDASSETSGYEGPSYDGPDWDAPIDELDGRFADAMANDERGSDGGRGSEDDEPRIDHAAAAALAEVVPPPAPAQTAAAAVLPAAGVPPRPPALVSSVRSAPALPPRPSLTPAPAASPVPAQAPAMSPTPAAASVAGRVAPRAVSVRPPGL